MRKSVIPSIIMGKILFQEKWRNRKLSNFQNQNNHFSLQFLLTQKKLKKNIIPLGKSPNYPEYHIKLNCIFISSVIFSLSFSWTSLVKHLNRTNMHYISPHSITCSPQSPLEPNNQVYKVTRCLMEVVKRQDSLSIQLSLILSRKWVSITAC